MLALQSSLQQTSSLLRSVEGGFLHDLFHQTRILIGYAIDNPINRNISYDPGYAVNVISRIKYQEINLGVFENYPISVQQFLPAVQHAMLSSITVVNWDFDEDYQGYFSHLAEKEFGDWVLPTFTAFAVYHHECS